MTVFYKKKYAVKVQTPISGQDRQNYYVNDHNNEFVYLANEKVVNI